MIGSRAAWSRVSSHLTDGDLSEQGKIILEHLGSFYDRDEYVGRCDPELLARDVARAMTNPKHKESFTNLVMGIAGERHSPSNVVYDYIAVKREAAGLRLASVLAAGRGTDAVGPLLEDYQQWAETTELGEKEDKVERNTHVQALVQRTSSHNLIQLWPPVLNQRLDGGLLRGHHCVVFARPEMGKTMFLVNAVAGFLDQGLTVLYIGNEEPTEDTRLRVISRLTGLIRAEIEADPEAAWETLQGTGYEKFLTVDLAPGTPRQMASIMAQERPDVLLIDQLRNVNMGEENYVVKLEKAATAARNLGKKYNALVVSVTQAGDSAGGKAILDMGDVDFSNTGIPAQADVMIGIGATREDEAMGRRVLSLCKNKRSGTHDAIPVNVNTQLSTVGE
jgi:archaellum biogenesis ATPase FlaH